MHFHLDPRVYKCLDVLRRSGKKGALAAARAEEIIARLQSGVLLPWKVGMVTKHGEARIRGVMKYDLGSGYRLVAYKIGERFFLLYAGTHDECHRWLNNNRELAVGQIQERCVVVPIRRSEGGRRHLNGDDGDCRDGEAIDHLPPISEKDLRRIFAGLAEAPQ